MDIKGLDKAELLMELYNGTKPLGMGFTIPGATSPMTYEEAKVELEAHEKHARDWGREELRFDYVRGRPIKVEFKGDELLRPDLYDRNASNGRCASIVERLKAKLQKAP